jgi:hypothetical protein
MWVHQHRVCREGCPVSAVTVTMAMRPWFLPHIVGKSLLQQWVELPLYKTLWIYNLDIFIIYKLSFLAIKNTKAKRSWVSHQKPTISLLALWGLKTIRNLIPVSSKLVYPGHVRLTYTLISQWINILTY